RRRWIFGLIAVVSHFGAAQATKPAAPSARTPSCAVRMKAAGNAGYKAGFDDGSKDGKAACEKDLLQAFDAGILSNDTDLKTAGGKTPIMILVEDIPQADAYRLAAAELITTFFPQHFVIAESAPLMLYVSGTNEISGTVSYDVSLQFYATVGVKSGGAAIPVTGTLVIENGGGMMANYSSEERARAVKEKMYSVLTKGDSELFPAPK
ncbi:MAG: hypothetical protein WAL73_03955, partial [Terracidiphilus sp.]